MSAHGQGCACFKCITVGGPSVCPKSRRCVLVYGHGGPCLGGWALLGRTGREVWAVVRRRVFG